MTTIIVLSLLTCFGVKCTEQTKFNLDTDTVVKLEKSIVTYCDAQDYEWPINPLHLTNCEPKQVCYVTDSEYGKRLVRQPCENIKRYVPETTRPATKEQTTIVEGPINNNEGRPVNMNDPNLKRKPITYTEGQYEF
jgi:hypothetical protein